MIDEVTLQRLGLIRYMYDSALEESRRPEPFNGLSILRFHDSVELFLDLACDKFGVPAKKTQRFMDYWTELERHLQGQSLSEKRSMDRLNDARVSFKHHGNLPHASSIEKFRVNVTDFFEENTPLIFEIEFSKISMTYLIQDEVVRTLLTEAEAMIEEERRWDALGKIAIAFTRLLDDFMASKEAWKNQKLFFSRDIFPPSYKSNTDRKLEQFAKDVVSRIDALRVGMQMLSLGIDYQRYIKFRLLTPTVVMYMDGRYEALLGKPDPDREPSSEKCRFCYDFVVASAIQLQNLDFGMEE